MGRKRNQGKARRAAKAKAREEAGESNNNQVMTDGPGQSLSAHLRQLQLQADEGEGGKKCTHGIDPLPSRHNSVVKFMCAIQYSFIKGVRCGDRSLSDCLIAAKNAALDEFADIRDDPTKLEVAMACFLYVGTDALLEGNYDDARVKATFARYIEQYIAVMLKQTQALPNWQKIEYTYEADLHTLVKFFRHRIPCSCLDEKYEEVKHITKMGHCWNPQCSIPDRTVERSKAKYCSRCRSVTYCSRECQVADWTEHKPYCDRDAARIAEFEAE